MLPDKRTTPWRDDLAAAHLTGQVPASRFVAAKMMHVTSPVADLYASPQDSALASQLIMGEVFDVYEVTRSHAWGQNRSDGYVGYVPATALTADPAPDPVTITALAAFVYPEETIKSTPVARLPFGATLRQTGDSPDFVCTDLGYIPKAHFAPRPADPIEAARSFLGIPYLWGGRSSFGLDCSALVQVMFSHAGQTCPRDSDLQMTLGTDVAGQTMARGDIVFWKGHVGIMTSPTVLLHANAHHMCVAEEPLSDAMARIRQTGGGEITGHRRALLA